MTFFQTLKKDQLALVGMLLITLSLIVFNLRELIAGKSDDFMIFCLNYGFVIIYAGCMIFYNTWNLFKNAFGHKLILLILLTISAFSLNREFAIFFDSSLWLIGHLAISFAAFFLLNYYASLPRLLTWILLLLASSGTILYLYFSIYLFPLYIFGGLGLFFFGISLHAFVPVCLLIITTHFLIKIFHVHKRYIFPYAIGLVLPLSILGYFLNEWHAAKKQIDSITDEAVVMEHRKLPTWVSVAQKMDDTWVKECLLKSTLIYTIPNVNDSFFWRMPSRSYEDDLIHDPLVVIASLLIGQPDITDDERIRVLEVIYDSRHKAQDRLWSGQDIKTKNILTNAIVYPEYRLAYIEKIISIENSSNRSWSQDEAIYTFHLPEGAVATSLSLWINGNEEKGILTSKGKADSAYKTIVGVESRDPSLVKWQEGNTVTVRVFPCTIKENRRFKIGFTCPISKVGEKLMLENIKFEGPSSKNANEKVTVEFRGDLTGLSMPEDFTKIRSNVYKLETSGDVAEWKFDFDAGQISEMAFSFDGKNYQMKPIELQYESFSPGGIYLDINKSWAKVEFDQILEMTKTKKVFVFTNELKLLTDTNADDVFDELHQLSFSMFPVNEMKNQENSLLITKCTEQSPMIKDLADTQFQEDLKNFFASKPKIKVFSLSDNLSTYLRTIKEMRIMEFEKGTITRLKEIVSGNKFLKSAEKDGVVEIASSGVQIIESADSLAKGAPDHLFRLFVYNDVLRKINSSLFQKDFESDELDAEAQKGYVVTPVSSLIVLESKADYDRFGIKNANNSLGNASKKGSGSVPEPHEWALIIIAVLMAGYLKFKLNTRAW